MDNNTQYAFKQDVKKPLYSNIDFERYRLDAPNSLTYLKAIIYMLVTV